MAYLVVRRATPGDAATIAEIQVRSWRAAYAGIAPSELLAVLDVPERTIRWRERLALPDEEAHVWIVERDDRAAGYAWCGPSADDDLPPGTAEVYAIYLHPDAFSTGTGRALFEHAVDDMRERGYLRAALWTLEENARARRFYEIAGWKRDGASRPGTDRAWHYTEVRYTIALTEGAPGWRRLGGDGESNR
jgi:GNAT superfamily N-acetyltransferase